MRPMLTTRTRSPCPGGQFRRNSRTPKCSPSGYAGSVRMPVNHYCWQRELTTSAGGLFHATTILRAAVDIYVGARPFRPCTLRKSGEFLKSQAMAAMTSSACSVWYASSI